MNGNGKKKNIGLFVCHCGVNIAGIVDVERVAKEMEDYPDIEFSTNYVYVCSEPGQKMILDTIKEKKLDLSLIHI